MAGFLERAGVELPIVQAGMGGGLASHELAAAVSEAGGLGTIGILAPDRLRDEIAAPRRLTDAASADAVIAQGVEAGGHVRGTVPAMELLERFRAALGPYYPILSAGGIADA